jgi:ParB-like chromosome segregation protein Spo0J
VQKIIKLEDIDPSPYQRRRYFDEDKLKELAASIQRDGLIEPIVVRPKSGRYELIVGERRLRAIRDYTEMETIQSQVVHVGDLQARRISAAENMQREDLSAIEAIEAIVEIVDAELVEDKEYATMGKTPGDRVKTLLGKLDSVRSSQERGSEVSTQFKALFHKFMEQVEHIFKNLPKPLEWRSFYNNDLPLLIDFCEEVRDASLEHHLNRSQTRALAKLKHRGRVLIY